jgi:hypothetical protein
MWPKVCNKISFLLSIYPYIVGCYCFIILKLRPEPPAHSFELLWAQPKLLLGQHLGLSLARLPALSRAGHITILKLSKHTQYYFGWRNWAVGYLDTFHPYCITQSRKFWPAPKKSAPTATWLMAWGQAKHSTSHNGLKTSVSNPSFFLYWCQTMIVCLIFSE